MKINCKIIEDLLPLYIDDVCSDESKSLIENHLNSCSVCRAKHDAQSSGFTIDKNIIDDNLRAKKPFKKIKRYNLILLSIAGVLSGTLCGSVVSYFIGSDKLLSPPLFGAFGGTILSLFIILKFTRN